MTSSAVHEVPPRWPGFMGGAHHSGASGVDLPGPVPERAWTFSPGDHVWHYEHGAGPWSAAVGAASVADETLVLAGSYDHNLYALDAADGREVWRFTTGARIDASPVVAEAGARTLVIVASADRSIYGLSADTGEKVWHHEVHPWSFTVPPAETGSPCVVQVGDSWLVLCTVWINDHQPFSNVQRAEVLAFDVARLLVGDDYGTVSCLDAVQGHVLWTYRAGHAVHSSSAIVVAGGRRLAVFGSFDRRVHALDVETGARVWSFETGDMIRSSPLVVTVQGKPAVVLYSMDRTCYLLDASDGGVLARFETGAYLWPVYTRGESVGSMPAALLSNGTPLVVLPGDDGVIYGWGGLRPGQASDQS